MNQERMSPLQMFQAAAALGIDLDDVNSPYTKEMWLKGMQTELEHGLLDSSGNPSPYNITDDNPVLTAKIVLAHLAEHPHYYDEHIGLPAMEASLGGPVTSESPKNPEPREALKHDAIHIAEASDEDESPDRNSENDQILLQDFPVSQMPISPEDYQNEARRTVNPDLDSKELLKMLCMGLAGESGEAVDLLKKHFYHDRELSKEKLVLELGDVLWYVANMASVLGVALSEVMNKNVSKLKERHPEGFQSNYESDSTKEDKDAAIDS